MQGSVSSGDSSDETFDLGKTLKDIKRQHHQHGHKEKQLDVAWKGLYVRGVGASAVYAPTMGR